MATSEVLSRRVLQRLMRYYRFLVEATARRPIRTITSGEIAEALEIDATQVRKDLGSIGLLGLGRVGFDVCEICRAIRTTVGFDLRHEAVLIGAGHLGAALLNYPGFATFGLDIIAAFDVDRRKVGRTIGAARVRSMDSLSSFIRQHRVPLAMITTPAEVAQQMTNLCVAAGVKAVWNFSPTQLTVPKRVIVYHEHIALGLSVLAYHLNGRVSQS
jgi:redox-sensing transcriptional repressor